ncbi:MAG TPA: hypothetical protein VMA72_01745 [Streptosporangiaceae bacterium]|nr:hypothetical protein [Streptosporangiaceae bacterium]
MMVRRLREAIGDGSSPEVADSAVSRGMADLLAALDVIDDGAALGRVYAGLGRNVPAAAPGRCAGTAAYEPLEQIPTPGSAGATSRLPGPAASPRPLVLRLAAAVVAALTAGAVVLDATMVPDVVHNGTDGPAAKTAFVVKRIGSALSAADRSEIAQMTVSTRDSATPDGQTKGTIAEEWSFGDQWRSVTDSPAGRLRYDEGSGTSSLYTLVSYPARTWAREPRSGHPSARRSNAQICPSTVAALPLLFQPGLPDSGRSDRPPQTVVGDLRASVACGTLAGAGRQRVDGIEAVKLESRPDSMISETIWVSPGTYLPVRVVIRPARGKPGPLQTADISWLRPTIQNLARMTVPIPAGFRQVSFAEAATPLLQHASAAPTL